MSPEDKRPRWMQNKQQRIKNTAMDQAGLKGGEIRVSGQGSSALGRFPP